MGLLGVPNTYKMKVQHNIAKLIRQQGLTLVTSRRLIMSPSQLEHIDSITVTLLECVLHLAWIICARGLLDRLRLVGGREKLGPLVLSIAYM